MSQTYTFRPGAIREADRSSAAWRRAPASKVQPSRFGAILGAGRSGTTWLGAIAASHPEVAYRFEPFTRLRTHDPAIAAAKAKVEAPDFSTSDLPQVYNALLGTSPKVEKPPFFEKSYATPLPVGRGLLWPLARKSDVCARIFQTLYTPRTRPFLVFKDVDKPRMLMGLSQRTDVPIAYILRHPCAVLSSLLRGQEKNLMHNSTRRHTISSRLDSHIDPTLGERYKSQLETLTIAEIEALMWRMETETALAAIAENPNSIIINYEELTETPHAIAERLFACFGLGDTLPQQSIDFIDASIRGDNSRRTRMKYGEIGINPYFSVFRNPKVSRDAWKEKMPAEERQQVLAIVRDSKAYAFGAQSNLWE